MTTASSPAPVGLFGGTFNPVHSGHLRSAIELVETLGLERLHLVPCAQPPHREQPQCSADHRAAMVELAVGSEPRLVCDRRELEREGPSYTVDTLASLRAELGPRRGLCLVIGFDALLGLDCWHRWESLLDYAHVVVIARPGWQLPRSGVIADWLRSHRKGSADSLRQRPCGAVLVQRLRQLAISSTDIRALLAEGRSARYLLPDPVLRYIERYELYPIEECT